MYLGDESAIAGQMIGMKLAVNEFVGYLEFAKYLQPDTAVVLSEKTKPSLLSHYVGFANFSSIAILNRRYRWYGTKSSW